MGKILEIKDICMYFGGVHAVEHLSTVLEEKEVLGIIGPNGSGKTTLINVLTGLYTPVSGQIIFDGEDITGKKPHHIAARGISRTFQNLRLFEAMTVVENVVTGMHTKAKRTMFGAMFRTPGFHKEEKELFCRADEILEFVGLSEHRDELAKNLAYGQQKRLELARALGNEPKICLLDEPAAGLNSTEAADMMRMIQRIRDEKNMAIILIEHNMDIMMKTADRIVVMDSGEKIAEDIPSVIQNEERVINVYLGAED